MRLSEFLRDDFIVTDLEGGDVDTILREVSARAAQAGVGPQELIADKLIERERAHSTVVGEGLAIPHATIPGLPEPVIGVALARRSVRFGPEDSEPVRVFFVLLSPPGSERVHVKLLARICRLVRHKNFIERLEKTESDEEVVRAIESIDAQHA